MPSPQALVSTGVVLGLGFGVTLIAVVGLGLRNPSCECNAPSVDDHRQSRFFDIVRDRAQRYLVDHPGGCPRIDEIATVAERVEYRLGHSELTCFRDRVWAWKIWPLPELQPES